MRPVRLRQPRRRRAASGKQRLEHGAARAPDSFLATGRLGVTGRWEPPAPPGGYRALGAAMTKGEALVGVSS